MPALLVARSYRPRSAGRAGRMPAVRQPVLLQGEVAAYARCRREHAQSIPIGAAAARTGRSRTLGLELQKMRSDMDAKVPEEQKWSAEDVG